MQILILTYARDSFSDPKPIPVRNYFNKKICAFFFIFVQVQYLTVSKQKDNKNEHTFIHYIRTNSYKTKKGLKKDLQLVPHVDISISVKTQSSKKNLPL